MPRPRNKATPNIEIPRNLAEARDLLETVRMEGLTLASEEDSGPEWSARFAQVMANYVHLSEYVTRENKKAAAIEEIRNMKTTAVPGYDVNFKPEPGYEPPTFWKQTDESDVFSFRGGRDHSESASMALRALDVVSEYRNKRDGAEVRPEAAYHVRQDPRFAEQMRALADPAYARAFAKVLAVGDIGAGSAIMTDEERLAWRRAQEFRAMGEGTVAAGLAGVPVLLDPTIVLFNQGAVSPFRQISKIVTGISNQWRGVTSTGVTANYQPEGATVADGSPTLSQPVITAQKAQAFVPYSIELEGDYESLSEQLVTLLADAKDRLEAQKFAVGTGTAANEPFGLVTRLVGNTTAVLVTTTHGAIGANDVYNQFAVLPARFRPSATWMSSISVQNAVRQLGDDRLGNLGSGVLPLTSDYNLKLLGRPYVEDSYAGDMISSTSGASFLTVGDFKQFVIFDRLGSMQTELVPHLVSTTSGLPTGQRGVYAYWRNGADVMIGSTTGEPGFRLLVNKTS